VGLGKSVDEAYVPIDEVQQSRQGEYDDGRRDERGAPSPAVTQDRAYAEDRQRYRDPLERVCREGRQDRIGNDGGHRPDDESSF
jgi:hypothetical protein